MSMKMTTKRYAPAKGSVKVTPPRRDSSRRRYKRVAIDCYEGDQDSKLDEDED